MHPEETRSDPVLADDSWCFVCGEANPAGLRTRWTLEGGVARTRFRAERRHQGWQGIVHGGILSSLLDEAMAKCLRLQGVDALTGRIDVRFRMPVPTGVTILAEARIVADRGRAIALEAAIVGADDGVRYCEAEGVCIRVAPGGPAGQADEPGHQGANHDL